MTAIYVAARTRETQVEAKTELDITRKEVDHLLATLPIWPGTENDGAIYKSRLLFQAVLDDHRSPVKTGGNVWDEVQFYTDLLDALYGWLTRHADFTGEAELWKWLVAYSYLLGSINYLGAEQALCSVFYSLICFSHRETFYYANLSFSGEAVFRLYRQSYPDNDRITGWKITPHEHFFPELAHCRKEIFSDMDYMGTMSFDPSACDYSRRNETRFRDTHLLTVAESERILTHIEHILEDELHHVTNTFILSAITLGTILVYIVLLHVVRFACIRCIQHRKGHKWKLQESDIEEEKMDQVALQQTSKMIRYEEYNCMPNNLHIKVATV